MMENCLNNMIDHLKNIDYAINLIADIGFIVSLIIIILGFELFDRDKCLHLFYIILIARFTVSAINILSGLIIIIMKCCGI